MNQNTVISARTRGTKMAAKKNVTSAIKVSKSTLYGLTQVFKLLSDESRLKILLGLAQDGELHVSALCDLLGQQQPAVSHHLTLLRMTGLVGYRREGKHNYYRLESGLVRDLLEQFFADAGNGNKSLHFDDFSLSYKRR
ncbi:MAG TPA: metalloregulator ArsR/SmtB family transcription factor [Gemmataceae bacterium]|nr:metalloregulator ArsR/SmtB family transcription factor [Gemmataceae bacterium]